MALDERVSNLIKRTYSAGEDQEAWDQVVVEVLDLCGGCAGLTTVVDLKNQEFSSYRLYGPANSDSAVKASGQGQNLTNDHLSPWAYDSIKHLRGSSSDLAHDSLSDEFLRWNRARFGDTHSYVGKSTSDEDLRFSFSIHFPPELGPRVSMGVELFKQLFDHMESAVRLDRNPFDAGSRRSLVLLDSAGSVRHVSDGAKRKLTSGAALKVENRRLVAAAPDDQARLDRAIAKALNTVRVESNVQAVKLAPGHGRPWIVVLRPKLGAYGPFGQARYELLLEVHDGLPQIGSIHLLQPLFELTGREMHVVRYLAAGHSVESLSACMGISANTARTHMRAIFAKTETGRQSELMHLCAGLGSGL